MNYLIKHSLFHPPPNASKNPICHSSTEDNLKTSNKGEIPIDRVEGMMLAKFVSVENRYRVERRQGKWYL
jgi:hypothetical protein